MPGDSSHNSCCFGTVFRAELAVVAPELPLPADAQREPGRGDSGPADAVDGHPAPLTALCLSGGGIRSATFGLGVLQGLAKFGLLGHFHYLSTVSGGGYIGSWLSAWRARMEDATVFAALNAAAVTGRDAPQIRGIRADSNYLTPTFGLLSADTWTVLTLYFRNLLLNWLLFVPFFTGCLLIPHLCFVVLDRSLQLQSPWPTRPFFRAGEILLAVSLAFAVYGRFRMQDRWLTNARFLALVLAPLVGSAVCFTAGAEFSPRTAAAVPLLSIAVDNCLHGAWRGATIYLVAWMCGRAAAGRRGGRIMPLDLLAWIASGAIVGVVIAIGVQIIHWQGHEARPVVILGLSGIVAAYLVGDILYAGLSSFSPRGGIDREWLARASGWLAATAVTWALISAIGLYAPDAVRQLSGAHLGLGLGVGGLSGLVTLLLGSSTMTAATKAANLLRSLSLTRIAAIAAVFFAVTLATFLSLLGQQAATFVAALAQALAAAHRYAAGVSLLAAPRILADAVLIVALIGLAFLISFVVNVNRFSLHALYRNRLIRAFLGSARAGARQPDPFTGIDPEDNVKLAKVVPKDGAGRLFHVINTTLNVVSSKNPAWQERKAESFAMTRQHCGNPFTGYRPTRAYGNRRGGLSLGTAMAISGAAISPNQGYSTSPLIGFLLMLFNVRLGWWLGNPRGKFFRREGPIWSIVPALKELAGATTDAGNWIYLSDGGHFDNLGLYEMIRRRCRCIVVSDAGCDPGCGFADLGNAVRKIYIDFGVSIDFDILDIRARQNPPVPGVCCALGTITYPGCTRKGWILYIKPTYHAERERADIRSYAAGHPAFPHESTTQQWFSESQLEAYRALGAHSIEMICNAGAGAAARTDGRDMTLPELRTAAKRYLGASRQPTAGMPAALAAAARTLEPHAAAPPTAAPPPDAPPCRPAQVSAAESAPPSAAA